MNEAATSTPDFCATPERATKRLLELFELLPERPVAAVDALLQAGANAATRGMSGTTPLHYAASNNDVDLIQLLLRHHAPINAPEDHGNTPLHFAARNRLALDAVRILLQAGADPSLRNRQGLTPLMFATGWPSQHYDNEVDSFLLPHPLTEINARDPHGNTALDLAIEKTVTSRFPARLADAGAYIHPRHANHHALRDRYKQAKATWQRVSANPAKANLTHTDLMRLSNLGVLGQLFTPQRWKDDLPQMQRLFHSLHPSLQAETLQHSPSLAFHFSPLPDARISDWTIEHAASKEPTR